ncbi:MAG: NAD-glutamate dehydrogenase [Leptospiraceae bacterium]|nr:NAD-glutamate dehydrogenase [Leptospiraceae bacterium]
MSSISKTFFEAINKSMGSIYLDFYLNNEINFLEQELWNIYEESKSLEPVYTRSYDFNFEDPLLRMNLSCIVIVCKSMPFFAANIRSLFHKKNLPINRSLHFHPESGKEMYYIEIQTKDKEIIQNIQTQIESSYSRILKLTSQFPNFTNKIESQKELKKSDKWLLVDWLLKKGIIWEGGAYLESGKKLELFGEVADNYTYLNWFTNLKTDSGTISIECKESEFQSFLGDNTLFYIAILHSDFRVLLMGSFTQHAETLGIIEIPFFNMRFKDFFTIEKIEYNSGLGRTVRRIFNSLPVEILFLMPESSYISLFKVIIEQSLKTENRSNGLTLTHDLAIILTTVPEKNWLETKWIESNAIIKKSLPEANVKSYHILLTNSVQCFHLIRSEKISKQILFEVSSQMEFLFRPWIDFIKTKWEDRFKDIAFPKNVEFRNDYIATHDPERAVYDLDMVYRLENKRVVFNIVETQTNATLIEAVTLEKEFALSQWVTALNSFGLSAISQRVYRFHCGEKVYSKTEFFFEPFVNENKLYERLKLALTYTMEGQLPADSLSGLLLKTNLSANALLFLKSIREYCLQTNPAFNRGDFNEILLNYPEFSEETWTFFQERFLKAKSYDTVTLKSLADQAKTIREDEVLNSIRTAILAILRTNFFGTIYENDFGKKVGLERLAVAYKIDSSIPVSLPLPRPFREIFVYSSLFQGIHLRGGAVARGGLRFSDRPSDFRTEVLSLMKTQMVKNTVIVPVGSKGGFVLSKNQYATRDLTMVEAYKMYVSSLLSLTDNRKGSENIPFAGENGPFALDGFDPYLVVAADKGTAQLSDTANEISIRKNFWLGDAFASGGSRGYSHKEFGITAKGALVTADRHLRNLGIDYLKDPITVIGIGDMGGDVFGNGLIHSKAYKLVAAFNHKHIFLDPNPDPEKSFEERKRLFYSKASGWDNYNPNLISKGGGVFEKSEKAISISPEMQKVLGITQNTLSGSALVSAILKAPVDLFYNGGIGTYVKAENEENSKVGDPANNEVRVNGSELRAKVVCEGGNLGFTQLGRIEYALNGGNIYTDALDNSAGVDLSDHEVNLKIFFNHLKEIGKIANDDERDIYLKEIANEVCHNVLSDNALQSLAVDADYSESILKGWDQFIKGSQDLISKKILHANTEKIPATLSDWEEWKSVSKGIPKPALCVLLSYAKMELYSESIRENSFQIEDFPELFYDYFPKPLVAKYKNELTEHPLKTEILNTQIINFYVNLMGFGGLLLLGDKNSSERMKYLKEIVHYLYSLRVDLLLKEIAAIREKSVEKETVKLLCEIRDRIRVKWGLSKEISLEGNKLLEFISNSAKEHIGKI